MENQIKSIFDRQKAYFLTDATKTYEWRIDQLTRLENMISQNVQAFKDALGKDFKTAEFEQDQEIFASLGTIEESIQNLKEWMEPQPAVLPKRMADTGHKGYIYREPFGVSLVVGPFNAPVVLIIDPLLAALYAGNTAIIKPSNSASAVATLFSELIVQYFNEECVAVVQGNRDAMTRLLELPFDFIFFTGSIPVGKIVMKAAAENLTPVLLELGGQNAVIVDKTANLREAARKISWGATAFAGQWCVSPGYVYVDESVAEEFVAECKFALVEIYGSDASKSKDYSRIISQKDVLRLAEVIKGANVVYGGNYNVEDRYFEPTLVFPASWDEKVLEEEIFGPILPIIPYQDVAAAIRVIKSKPKGLASYIFSSDQKAIDTFLNSVSSGGGAVNQNNMQVFLTSLPFGGVGTSGLGKYFGKHGFDSFSNIKSILVSDPNVTIDDFLPPYSADKKKNYLSWFLPE